MMFIIDDGDELVICFRIGLVSCSQGGAVMWFDADTVPLTQVASSPLIRLITMALGTGIGCVELVAEVGSRHTETVITTEIDTHIVPARHMTVDAKGTFTYFIDCGVISKYQCIALLTLVLMEMVIVSIVSLGKVALQAKLIAGFY